MRIAVALIPAAGMIGFGGCSDGAARHNIEAPLNSIFHDITESSQLIFHHDLGLGDTTYYMPESMGSGGGFLDYDSDGDLDVYLVNGARRLAAPRTSPLRNQLFRQESDHTFTNVTDESGLGDTGFGMGVAAGDIDNDGDVDVYVTNVGDDQLYRNNGDGTFTLVTSQAGIRNPNWGTSVALFDFDVDGFLDIYVTNYVRLDTGVACVDLAGRRRYCGPFDHPAAPDVLFHNRGDGTFRDISQESGIGLDSSPGLSVVSADFTGDGYPDIYVANDREPNYLWINRGDGTFHDQAVALGAAVNGFGQAEASMGIGVGDVDGDLHLDLFVTHLSAESNTLYMSDGRGFVDNTLPSQLGSVSLPYTGFGTGFFDYDHDGDVDLAVVNGRVTRGQVLTGAPAPGFWDDYAEPNLLFENDGTGRFRHVTDEATAFSESITNSRALAFGDVDNDGDVDLLMTSGGGRAQLFRNDTLNKGHWLLVRAVDPRLQRDAIGAEITVVVGDRRLRRVIAPSYSYLSTNDHRAHFGLGNATQVDQITVRWPDGHVEILRHVAADQILTVERGRLR